MSRTLFNGYLITVQRASVVPIEEGEEWKTPAHSGEYAWKVKGRRAGEWNGFEHSYASALNAAQEQASMAPANRADALYR